MTLRERIILLFNSRNTRNIDRDIEVILTYFGLGNLRYPTYDSIGNEFGVGTRERVRQIIKRNFIDKVEVMELESVVIIEQIINRSNVNFVDDLLLELIDKNVIEENVSIKGLLNLLHDYKMCENYGLYNLCLNQAARIDIELDKDLLIITKDKRELLRRIFLELRTYPGQHGICNLNEICRHKEISDIDFEFFKRIISLTSDSWTAIDDDGTLWYTFEDRNNVITNSLEKLNNITTNIDINILSNILYDSINKRTLQFRSPPENIIRRYLENSRFLSIRGQQAILSNLYKSDLLEIEREILNCFKISDVNVVSYSHINNYLKGTLRFDIPHIKKALYSSSLMYIDRSEGRKKFKFILASRFSKENIDSTTAEVEYDSYKERLRGLNNQTDVSGEIKNRREQYILREWLFRGKSHEKCAICGNLYMVGSLVTAHKKKRATCSDSERTDPNIVMSLCLFGCDYLYEKDKIRVVNDRANVEITDEMTQTEKDYLKNLSGKQIDEKWLKGSKSYFIK